MKQVDLDDVRPTPLDDKASDLDKQINQMRIKKSVDVEFHTPTTWQDAVD